MTVKEMKQEIDAYCSDRFACNVTDLGKHKCPLLDDNCTYDHNDEDNIKQSYEKLFGKPPVDVPTEEPTEVTHDVINKPNHYCRDGAMECIDEMVLVFGKEVVKNFCLCNIWKYRYRSAAKNGEEDIKKSDRYVQIYKGLISNER